MPWVDSNVERGARELLWTRCDGDPVTSVPRTGVGNAVRFLGIRGCVDPPPGGEG